MERAVPAGRRVELHRQILAHLVVTSRDEPARLAHHAEEAGMAAAVLEHATAAAERAAALGAHREAVDHYATALRFAGGLEDRRLAELLERYAAECAHTDRATEALQAAERALECWRRAGDREREAALLARRCMYLWGVGRSVEALESAATAVAMLEAAPPGPALATAYTHLASMRMLAREIPGAIEAGGRAIELAERFGEHEQLSRALNAVGAAQWFSDPDQAPLTLGRSLDVAKEHGYDQMAAIAMTNLGSGAGEIRGYALADRWLRDAIAWSAERDLDSNRRYASAWLARCHFEQGRWSEAGTTVARLAAEGVAMSPTRIVALTVLGRLRTRRGDPDARAPLEEAWELATQTGDLQRTWPVAAGRAEQAWLDGRPAAVPGLVAEPFELARRLGRPDASRAQLGEPRWPVCSATVGGGRAAAPPGRRPRARRPGRPAQRRHRRPAAHRREDRRPPCLGDPGQARRAVTAGGHPGGRGPRDRPRGRLGELGLRAEAASPPMTPDAHAAFASGLPQASGAGAGGNGPALGSRAGTSWPSWAPRKAAVGSSASRS